MFVNFCIAVKMLRGKFPIVMKNAHLLSN